MMAGMDDLLALVDGGPVGAAAARAHPRRDAVAGLIALVESPDTYRRRSSLLTKHMRKCKRGKPPEKTQPSEIVLEQVKRHNRRFAVRSTDVIDLSLKKRRRQRQKTGVAGKGQSRKWTKAALQRACWGRGWRPVAFRRIRTKSRQQPRNAVATSQRGLADTFECSHSFICEIRDAVASKCLELQETKLRELGSFDNIFLQIAFDESEQWAIVDNLKGIYNMMMVHARVHCGDAAPLELAIPPAFVERSTATCMLRALSTGLPVKPADLCRQADVSVIGIVSDSAKACIKLGRSFLNKHCTLYWSATQNKLLGELSIHARCLMHQVALVVARLMKNIQVLCPMFCACCLMQKAGHVTTVKKATKKVLERDLEIVYEAPPERNYFVLREIFRLLNWGRDLGGDDEAEEPRRKAHASETAQLLHHYSFQNWTLGEESGVRSNVLGSDRRLL